ncbi:MAG: efflux RND transporter periplasmic adaptor subunit [Bacteroidales bacterium]|nr:efflux RND transporter periplasmic adaptor subunit [Bacteroidales bacterium]
MSKIVSQSYILLIALCIIGCSHASHDHDETSEEQSHSLHNADEGVATSFGEEIILNPSQAERFGVETKVIEPTTIRESFLASGEVVTSSGQVATLVAPTTGVVKFNGSPSLGASISAGATLATIDPVAVAGGDQNAMAKAALEAAQREVDRLRPLVAEGLATRRELESAEGALAQAKAAYSPLHASSAVRSSLSGTLSQLYVTNGEYVTAGQPIAVVSDNAKVSLRVDVPQRFQNLLPTLKSASLRIPDPTGWKSIEDMGGQMRTGALGTTPNTTGFLPLYISLINDGSLYAGSFVEVMLLGSPRDGVVALPRSAFVESQGAMFVYEKVDDHGYIKHQVTIGASDDVLVEVLSPNLLGREMVVAGAPILRLAETSSLAPQAHSHSH